MTSSAIHVTPSSIRTLELTTFRRLTFVIAGSLITMGLLLFNGLVLERRLLEKISPVLPLSFGPLDFALSVICAAAAICFTLSIVPRAKPTTIQWGDFGAGYTLFALAMAGILVATVVLTMVFPVAFYDHVAEVMVISLSQEILLFGAVVLLLIAASRASGDHRARLFGLPGPIVVLGMATAVTLLLLEEISYGQHFFGWDTPERFERNEQNETNIHNFYTNRFEFLYYNAPFIAFVLMPLWLAFSRGRIARAVSFYVPPLAFALCSLPMLAFIYESWTILPYRIELFFGGFLAAFLVVNAPQRFRAVGVGLLALYGVTAFFVLILGDKLIDGYEIEEMRELAICLAVFAYAVWLFARLGTHEIADRRAAD